MAAMKKHPKVFYSRLQDHLSRAQVSPLLHRYDHLLSFRTASIPQQALDLPSRAGLPSLSASPLTGCTPHWAFLALQSPPISSDLPSCSVYLRVPLLTLGDKHRAPADMVSRIEGFLQQRDSSVECASGCVKMNRLSETSLRIPRPRYGSGRVSEMVVKIVKASM